MLSSSDDDDSRHGDDAGDNDRYTARNVTINSPPEEIKQYLKMIRKSRAWWTIHTTDLINAWENSSSKKKKAPGAEGGRGAATGQSVVTPSHDTLM